MARMPMTEHGVTIEGGGAEPAFDASEFWWMWLIVGIGWIIASLVILQFNSASVTTIGIIVGLFFTASGIQNLILAAVVDSMRWLWAIFGVVFLIAGVICFINPESTFKGLADILGFLFLCVGVWWTLRAFLVREIDPLWWLGLIGAVILLVMAFWASGQFFLEKAYTLLVFAGIWALMQGITDIVRAFQVRAVRRAL